MEAYADYLESLESHEVLPDDVEDSPVVARLFKELDEVKAQLRASAKNRLWLDTYLRWYDTFLVNLHGERLGQWDAYRVAETAASVLRLWSPEKLHKVRHLVFVRIKPTYWRNGDQKESWRVCCQAICYGVRRYLLGSRHQSMMGAIKGKTGLIRGHEFTELNYLTWLLNRPVIIKVNNAMKEMTGYSSKICQTLVKVLRMSRIRRDCDDKQTIHDFTTIQKEVLSAPTKPKNNTKNHLQQNTNSQC